MRTVFLLIPLLVLSCRVLSSDGANILVLFFPIYSHIRGSLNVASELASRGHVVWNALPTTLANDKRLQVPGVKPLTYTSLDDVDIEHIFVDKIIDTYFETGKYSLQLDVIKNICDRILRDQEFFSNALGKKFDLVVLSTIILARMLTVFPYKLDCPYIFLGPSFDPLASRSPFVLSTFPLLILPLTPEMDFKSRVISSLGMAGFVIVDPFSYSNPVARYAPEKPYISMEALTAKGLLWLVDLEPLLHYPQALLPNVKFVGSLSASSPKKLPEKYQKFMDEAKNGVVIVSFGSYVKNIPQTLHDRLISTFKQTPYRYIFKTDKKSGVSSEIMLPDWMPQADLLAHSNTKLFLTHCGANGQNEGFLNGVPMIGFPMFAEQYFNAEKIVYHGFGSRMDLLSFSVDELVRNINEIIVNESYSQKIKKAAALSKLRERSPKDEAVYWIEHVIQYGGEHLRSYCQDMPLYQFLNLDVIGLLLFIFHLSVFIIWKLCSCLFRRCCKRSSAEKRKRD